MPKRGPAKRKQIKLRRTPRYLKLAVVLLVAGIGSYFVVASHAEGKVPPTALLSFTGGYASFQSLGSPPQPKSLGNKTYDIPFYAAGYGPSETTEIESYAPYQLDLSLSLSGQLHSEGLTCTKVVPCYASKISEGTWTNAVNQSIAQSGFPQNTRSDMPQTIVCVNVNSQTIPILNVDRYSPVLLWLKVVDAAKPDPNSYYSGGSQLNFVAWDVVVEPGMAPGSCQSNPTGNGLVALVGNICADEDYGVASASMGCDGIGNAGILCGFSNDEGGCPSGSGSGSSSTGKGSKGTGKGGGSSGAAASRQSSAKNSVPKSSPAGTKKQAKALAPSPFYDGKEYQPGSETDTEGVANLTVAPRHSHHLYLLIGAGIVVAVAAVIFIVKKRRDSARL